MVPNGPTTCDTVFCDANEHVVNFECMPCAPGSTNDAGDDATAGDSQCACSDGFIDLSTADVLECIEANFAIQWGFGMEPDPLANAVVKAGDVLVFVWDGTHNVQKMDDDTCTSFTGGVLSQNVSPYTYQVTEEDAGITLHFGCKIGSHCTSGVKAKVVVAAAATECKSRYRGSRMQTGFCRPAGP